MYYFIVMFNSFEKSSLFFNVQSDPFTFLFLNNKLIIDSFFLFFKCGGFYSINSQTVSSKPCSVCLSRNETVTFTAMVRVSGNYIKQLTGRLTGGRWNVIKYTSTLNSLK